MPVTAHRHSAGPHIGAGMVSLLLVLLAFAAYHDIGSGEQNLTSEYGILFVAGGWFVLVVAWLFRSGRWALAGASLIALAVLAWATWQTAPAPAPFTIQAYWSAVAGFLWLVVLPLVLLARGFSVVRAADRVAP